MRVKQIKRRCMVNGCRNTASFHITRRNQLGNSIHICEKCLREAIECIDNTKHGEETEEKFICELCGKEYKTAAGLAAHMEKAHAEN